MRHPHRAIIGGLGAALLGLSACGTTDGDGNGRGWPFGGGRSGSEAMGEWVATGDPVDLTDLGAAAGCRGQLVDRGRSTFLELADGSLVAYGKMRVNVDGSGRAYHRDNYEGGSILHLCNAGEVHLPDGTRYHGSKSNAICTGKFMDDVERIRAAGWTDPEVGAVRWYGVHATGSARIAGRVVPRAIPVEQPDGSGFYVSQTTLEDRNFAPADQRRYVDPLVVSHAVVRNDSDIPLGTFGVAYRARGCRGGRDCAPIPFIVADIGPRVGEGSVALSRAVNGLPFTTDIDRENRYDGDVSSDDILWVFFGGTRATPPYTAESVSARATAAYETWGGQDRVDLCLRAEAPVVGE